MIFIFIVLQIGFTIVLTIVLDSILEGLLHQHVMHKPILGFRYSFHAHAKVHHGNFRSDHTYHADGHPEDIDTIRMAWWNGMVLIAISTAILTPIISFLTRLAFSETAVIVATITGMYYGTYEYLHWCMHLPKSRRLEMSFMFRRLNGHHLLHHRYTGKNFNVVLPLYDWLTGTLLTRAPSHFNQPQHSALPNVQPLQEKVA